MKMKKFLSFICVLLSLSTLFFAQTTEQNEETDVSVEETVDEKALAKAAKEAEKAAALEAKQKAKEEAALAKAAADEEKAKAKAEAAAAKLAAKEAKAAEKANAEPQVYPVRLGGYGQFQPITGQLADYLKYNVGGGLGLEVGLPAFEKFELGFTVGSAVNANPVKVETLKSVMNVQSYLGMYFAVPFGESGFSFHPELDYGMVVYFPKASENCSDNDLKKSYIDQLLVTNLGFRYMNPAIAKGHLEFELAPTLTLAPEKGTVGVFAGGRLGIFYRVNGPDVEFSEEALAKRAAKAEAKAEKKAAAAELKAAKEAEKAAAAEAKQKEKEEAAAAAAELKAAKEAEKAAAAEAKKKAKEGTEEVIDEVVAE